MAIEIVAIPAPPSLDTTLLADFGREVKGLDPARLSESEFKELESLLYKVTHSVHPLSIVSEPVFLFPIAFHSPL
jgi:hypothetical protein